MVCAEGEKGDDNYGEEQDNVVVITTSAPVQFRTAFADCVVTKAAKCPANTLTTPATSACTPPGGVECDLSKWVCMQLPTPTPNPACTTNPDHNKGPATDVHCDVPPPCLDRPFTPEDSCPPPSTHGSCEVGGSREESDKKEQRKKAKGLGRIKNLCRGAAKGTPKDAAWLARIIFNVPQA